MSAKSLGAIIAHIRKNEKIRQGKFAKRIEVTQSYLSQIEDGKKEPSPGLLKKISQELALPVGFIQLLSIVEDDVPKKRRHMWQSLTPTINALAISIFPEKLKGL